MQIREHIYQLQQCWQVGMAEAGKSEVILLQGSIVLFRYTL